ncbi:hypothetical protein [Schaalia hyovaginalis]|uniref:hypothetical protein n=1 Tax=Schaalia hyovaginalis TaxID=29316 RepID=UPI001F2DF17F|nr:hypothetical protein [Schaalia hyovaginalis]MCF2710556.1 hypothetical protein [Schaalia hyovaginalis]
MHKKPILIIESLVITCALFLATGLMAPSALAASPQPQASLISIASIEDSKLADTPVNPLTIRSLGNGHATIEVDGQSVTAAFDASSGLFRVTYSDGNKVFLPPPPGFSPKSIEPLSPAQLASLKNTVAPSPLILPNYDAPAPPMLAASNSTLLCSYAIWVVTLVHHAGWSAALAAALAAGAAGAAVVAFIYAYGFDALMVWVSTKC